MAVLSAGVGALAVAAIADPLEVLARADLSAPGNADPWAAVGGALLLAASAVAWILALWCLLVLAVGVGARVPGTVGRASRLLLGRVTPAGVRRVVLIAVGCSVAAGTAACGPASSPPASPSAAVAVTTMTQSLAPTAALGGSHDPSASAETLDLDWPLSPPAQAPVADQVTDQVADPAASPAADPVSSSVADPAASPVTDDDDEAAAALARTPSTTKPRPPTHIPTAAGSPAPPSAGSSAESSAGSTPAAHRRAAHVIVRRGDTLWSIAAAHLPTSATDAEIDTEWRAWYSANRSVIGDDPDLLIPGQQLQPPHRKGHRA